MLSPQPNPDRLLGEIVDPPAPEDSDNEREPESPVEAPVEPSDRDFPSGARRRADADRETATRDSGGEDS